MAPYGRPQLERDMTYAMKSLMGSGYVAEYYEQLAGDFVTVAQYYADEMVKDAVAQAVRDTKRQQRWARPPTRYRFVGRDSAGQMTWESVLPVDGSRYEQVTVAGRRFWGREYPSPTSDDAVSPTNDSNPTQAVGNGGPIGEKASSGRTEVVS
jgi:hypothetical protein